MHVVVETVRPILRQFTIEDVDNLVELDGDEHGDVEYAITREEWEEQQR